MDDIILVGAGGHARACIDVIELIGTYRIAGLIEKDDGIKHENIGYPIIGTDADLPDLRYKFRNALVTVGQIKSAAVRIKLFKRLVELEYQLPVIVSPLAYVSKHTEIGKGTIIFHHAILNVNARIGQNCIINNKALIEHDSVIGDHCHISTAATLNGGVIIGDESFIGSRVVTKETISIGPRCVIGAGVVIKKDVKSDQLLNNE